MKKLWIVLIGIGAVSIVPYGDIPIPLWRRLLAFVGFWEASTRGDFTVFSTQWGLE